MVDTVCEHAVWSGAREREHYASMLLTAELQKNAQHARQLGTRCVRYLVACGSCVCVPYERDGFRPHHIRHLLCAYVRKSERVEEATLMADNVYNV